MKNKKNRSGRTFAALTAACLSILLFGCGVGDRPATPEETQVPRELTIAKDKTNNDRDECKGSFDYVDVLMLGDVLYYNHESLDERGRSLPPDSVGDRIGEVLYTMYDDACQDFVMQSGDAAFVPTGTPIYRMKDYDPDFRIVAEGRIFEAGDNPNAKTIGDLYDIEGKVSKISRVNGNDGSVMSDFDPEDTEQFVSDMLSLKYVGFEAIFKDNSPEYKTSLRIFLQDGTSIDIGYMPKANALTQGAYGTERMLAIVRKYQ